MRDILPYPQWVYFRPHHRYLVGDVVSNRELSYTVVGMTCDHCKKAVMEAIEQLGGVTAVDVDLMSGHVVVRGANLSDGAVRAAIREARYEIE